MKQYVLMTSLLLFSSVGLAGWGTRSIYECRYEVQNSVSGKISVHSGHLIDDAGQGELYRELTLEPLSSSEIRVTARAVIFRFEEQTNYIPMSLHPRGDTVTNLAHAILNTERGTTISYQDADHIYTFTCAKAAK